VKYRNRKLLIEPNRLVVREEPVVLPTWPDPLDGMKWSKLLRRTRLASSQDASRDQGESRPFMHLFVICKRC
jgi:hypothetical protein